MSSLKNRQIVKSLIEKFKNINGLILTEYHGLTVKEISDLRSKLYKFDSEYLIAKNTLSRIAIKNVGIKINDVLSGPIAFVIENGDVISPTKAVVEFAKNNEKLKIKSGFFEGKFVDSSVIRQLSELPSKEILVKKVLISMNAPITEFVNILMANIIGLINTLNAIIEK
ncbi:MAG: 50S ribosomal protein L10 [Endomicrobium sp.]|jgi:large subunit ribosomal protein L10|nr:50S ribosomal protein L10 [Endomicrobium sp.]